MRLEAYAMGGASALNWQSDDADIEQAGAYSLKMLPLPSSSETVNQFVSYGD